MQEHRTSNLYYSVIEFSDFKMHLGVILVDKQTKEEEGGKGGEGRFEINCLAHPIIISAWLLNCPDGPVCAQCTPKSISTSADTAGKRMRYLCSLTPIAFIFTSPLSLIALLSDGHV